MGYSLFAFCDLRWPSLYKNILKSASASIKSTKRGNPPKSASASINIVCCCAPSLSTRGCCGKFAVKPRLLYVLHLFYHLTPFVSSSCPLTHNLSSIVSSIVSSTSQRIVFLPCCIHSQFHRLSGWTRCAGTLDE